MIIWIIAIIVLLPFAVVLLFGAPYLPTRKAQAKQALDLLNLKRGDIFVDLGSGDGALLIEAAKRGLECYGYELNPFIWFISRLRTARFGKQVHIRCRNFWNARLPEGTKGVFVFLLDKYMPRLDKKLSKELGRKTKLVSYTFKIPHKEPQRSEGAMFLYRY